MSHATGGGTEPPPSGRRISTWLRITVSVALLGFEFSRIGVTGMVSAVRAADPRWALLGLGLGVAAAATTVTQWWVLLRLVGLRRRWTRCVRYELAGDLFDASLPTSIGGDVLRVGWSAEARSELPDAAVSVLLRRVGNLPGLLVVLGAGVVLSADAPWFSTVRPYVLAAASLAAVVLVVVLGAGPRLLVAGAWRRLGRVGRAVGEIGTALRRAPRSLRGLGGVYLVGIGFWALVSASGWAYFRAAGAAVPVGFAVVVVIAVNVVSMVPVSVGGYGVREGVYGAALAGAAFGTSAQGVLVGLAISAQTLVLGLVGLPFYLTLPARRRRPPAVPATT